MLSLFSQIGNIFVITLPATSGLFLSLHLVSAQQFGGEVAPTQATIVVFPKQT